MVSSHQFNQQRRNSQSDKPIMSAEESQISRFFANKSILISGATGFIGKVLVEKLLFSCPNLDKIYLLIRGAKGKTPHERMIEMISRRPFNFRLKHESIVHKLVAVDSDLTKPGLGLSSEDRTTLTKNISVVFHVAASVKFDAPIEINMQQNVIATKEMLDLAVNFEKLNCFVQVSTAYSNCQLKHIDERVYTMEVPDDPMQMKFSEEMLENRPNTYTYTKAIAENVVCNYSDRINIAIARPSIVMPAQQEPAGGWVDSLNGPVGLSLLASLGLLQKVKYNTEVVFDMIPVDIVTNALISIAWATSQPKTEGAKVRELGKTFGNSAGSDKNCDKRRDETTSKEAGDKSVKVYNLTTGSENPCTFYHYFSSGRQELVKKPSVRALRPALVIPRQKGMNSILYWLHKIFSHLLFAFIIDTLLTLFGHKKMALRAVNRMHLANEMFAYFGANQWSFETNNVKRLRECLSLEDRKTFNFDVRSIDWTSFARLCWLGCRRYILNENDDNMEYAKRRYLALCFTYYAMKLFLVIATTTAIRFFFTSAIVKSTLLMPTYGIIYLL